jgi:hypothetical protein
MPFLCSHPKADYATLRFMKGLDHASYLKSLARELVTLTEERSDLKVELAALKKGKKTSAGAARQKAIHKRVKELSQGIEALINDIGQPPPWNLEGESLSTRPRRSTCRTAACGL